MYLSQRLQVGDSPSGETKGVNIKERKVTSQSRREATGLIGSERLQVSRDSVDDQLTLGSTVARVRYNGVR